MLGQVDHDLHVAQTYLNLRRSNPELACRWRSEDALPPAEPGGYLPDAVLGTAADWRHVIEFAGAYKPERVAHVHSACKRRGVSYDLW